MKSLRLRVSASFVVAALVGLPIIRIQAADSNGKADEAAIVGDWHGSSVCVIKPGGCNDEDSLYHVAQTTERPGWFLLTGDKIVNGKPVTMGTMECSYDRGKKTLLCEFENGVFQFTVAGDEMKGTMKLKDGTLWRRINLKKTK